MTNGEDYRFETFLVDGSNRLACTICQRAAQHPGQEYNPIMIYGPSGCGKTHLLQSTVRQIRDSFPDKVVRYISAETLVTEMLNGIRNQRLDEYHEWYDAPDVLILDNVQHLAGKKDTQEEFFRRINWLYTQKKQVLLALDCPPCELPVLLERLQTRFETFWLVDIRPPEPSLKKTFLRTLAQEMALDLTPEAVDYLARKEEISLARLKGRMKKVRFLCGSRDMTIDPAWLKQNRL